MADLIETPQGDARITWFRARAVDGSSPAVLALSHGAGGGIEAADLQALAAALPGRGYDVALVEQPWRVAGKRLAPAPKTLDVGWRAVVAHLAELGIGSGGRPLVVGGRSAGARVACRTGLETGAAAVLALAFPLHPPGKPEKSREGELLGSGLPTLVVQGATDPFGGPDAFPPLPVGHRLLALPVGNHEFAVRKSQEPVLDTIATGVAAWLDELFAA